MVKARKIDNRTLISNIILDATQQATLLHLLPLINVIDEANALRVMHIAGFILNETIFKNESNNKIIADFKNGSTHAFLVENFPIEKQLPSTPYTGICPIDNIGISAMISFGMMSLLNLCPVTYRGENDDRLIRHVIPKIDAINDVSSHGSKLDFGFHVDNPDLALVSEKDSTLSACPEYLSLHSIRGDHSVPTKLLFLDDIISLLPQQIIETLLEPKFIIKRPDSFVGMNVKIENRPVLSYDAVLGMVSRFDRHNVLGVDPKSSNALDYFIKIIEDSNLEHKFIMEPGNYLIFHNQKTLHARDAFQPRLDGTDRWLIRLFGLKNLKQAILSYDNIPYILQ